MPQNFLEQIIIVLIVLLFAKDLAVPILRKLGWVNGVDKPIEPAEIRKDVDANSKKIDILQNHANVANREMGEVKAILDSHTHQMNRMEKSINNIYNRIEK